MTSIRYRKLNPLNIGLLVLLTGSTMQYLGIVDLRVLIPVVALLTSAGLLLLSGSFNKNDRLVLLLHIVPLGLLIAISAVGAGTLSDFGFGIAKITFAVMLSYVAYFLSRHVQWHSIQFSISVMILFAIAFLVVDAAMRFHGIHASVLQNVIGIRNFYVIKVDDPFFSDSNGVGLYALSFMVILLSVPIAGGSLRSTRGRFNNRLIARVGVIALCFFIVLTFSRAAIITMIVVLGLFIITRSGRIAKYSGLLCLAVAALAMVPWFLSIVSADASGETKLQILHDIARIATPLSSSDLLFGFGVQRGGFIYSYVNGGYGHILLVLLFGQVGILGILVYFLFFAGSCIAAKGKTWLLLVMMGVVGLSFLPPFFEMPFLANGIILGLSAQTESQKVNLAVQRATK